MGDSKFSKPMIYNGEKEFQLICPICGCDEFSEKSILMDKFMNPVPMDATIYTCRNCTNMLFFEKPKRNPFEEERNKLNPVKEYEQRFMKYSDAKLEKIIDSSSYTKEAKKAAQNLLRQKKYIETKDER